MHIVIALLLLAAFVYFAGPDLLRLGRAIADRVPLVRAVPRRFWNAVGVALAVFVGVLTLLLLVWGGRDFDDAFAFAFFIGLASGVGYFFPNVWRWARDNPRAALRLLGSLFAVVAFVFFIMSVDRYEEESVVGLVVFGTAAVGVFWYLHGKWPAQAIARGWEAVQCSKWAAEAPSPCLTIGQLKDLLAERLSPREQVRLAAHLDRCTSCQHRAEGLTAGQESWVGMARNLGQQPPAAPALKRVINNLKGDDPREATKDVPAFAGDLPLSFLSPSDKPGQLGRLERYEVLEEVGRGGFGVVLKAFDPSLHRVVAIKVLAPQLATSGVARKRFLREAKSAAAVTHDHIVTIHAVDEANGLPYLVMQFVAGLSLQDRIDKEGPLSDVTEILRIGMQTASGLAAAHSHGIVHRDVKPGNILLEEGVQRVKITDFGLARAMDDASLTQSGLVAGSPLYMAPEQARGESLDHRADLFSLGSVLYTMCTGRPPFRAANTLAVLRRVSEDTARPIRETNPEVPDWLAAVVDKLMAKDPADRFQSAGEVVEVLGRHLAEFQHHSPVPPPPPRPADAGLPTSVTLCPSCGASLHVPDRMLGGTVHCGECGEPFLAEDGSQEILVARAAPSPFGRRGRSPLKIATWIMGGIAGLLFVAVLLLRGAREDRRVRSATIAPIATEVTVRPGAPHFWKSSLALLPAEATLFGAVDLARFGSLGLDDEWTQAAFSLFARPGAANKLTPENLGRVRIDSVALAYYEDEKPEKSRGLMHLEGLALDGRKRTLDYIRDATTEPVRIEECGGKSPAGRPVRVSGPELPFALGFLEDHHLFLARSLGAGGRETRHLEALEHLHWFDLSGRLPHSGDILSGYNPPWLKSALAEVPSDACGLFLGTIPAAWRRLLTETMDLRACPRTFVVHMRREGDRVAVSLRLNMEKAGTERLVKEDLERWRGRFPVVRREEEALATLDRVFNTMRWEAHAESRSVTASVSVSARTGKALRSLAKRAFQTREEGEKQR